MRFSEERFEAHVSLFSLSQTSAQPQEDQHHDAELSRTPLFSSHVQRHLTDTPFSQYGLIGMQQAHHVGGFEMTSSDNETPNLVYGNHGEPWSTFICGSQGTGKSHTLANLLENCLLPKHPSDEVPNPLTAIAFHFDPFTSFYSTQHCELAYFCSAGIKVRVLVSPENLDTMTRLYANLPGLPAGTPKPEVFPFKVTERQLNIANMMTLMNVKKDGHTPLYVASINSILRQMKREQNRRPGINYLKFRELLGAQKYNETQVQMLNLRLQLLDECLGTNIPGKGKTGDVKAYEDVWKFEPGTLTIVDLSSEFVNAGDTCALFTVCLNLFMARRCETGRVVVLDEAHKFLTDSAEAQKLTGNLMSIIRQQRHLGTRVMIATQEPTLDTRLLDLCNVVIVHHFSSPAWFDVLKGHLAGSRGDRERSSMINEIFSTIVKLKTGHALIFAPRATLHIQANAVEEQGAVATLGDGYVRVLIRPRVTADGGRSITAQDVVEIEEEEVELVSGKSEDGGNAEEEDLETGSNASSTSTLTENAIKEHVAAAPAVKAAETITDPPPIGPTVAQIDIALRNNVRPLVIRGKDNKLYVDHGDVRKRAAAEVGANVHFLKAQGHVARSKQIILEEFARVKVSEEAALKAQLSPSPAQPPANQIGQVLRQTVSKLWNKGKQPRVTGKGHKDLISIRHSAAGTLGVPLAFFENVQWHEKSKTVILEEMERLAK